MIVRQHHPCAAVERRIGDDLPQREIRSVLVTHMARNMKAARIIVEVSNPQPLERKVILREAAGEEVARRSEAVEL